MSAHCLGLLFKLKKNSFDNHPERKFASIKAQVGRKYLSRVWLKGKLLLIIRKGREKNAIAY
ncbi:MAG: hypothetical protein DSM107014_01085 [Gomphosphaeria aponina SAG 52.96 = DSM 107014]|uniref:Uncharacterized protein n=1 Tax=Gomphosphaeria aponina SAG 52.96 = DSM 107014 TaxID=1521640 RepID=A0A941JR73_9CHRO|nr:hypothetical protein [Gomphosphaeria aponina SAG 52.96 = DSM 107014]